MPPFRFESRRLRVPKSRFRLVAIKPRSTPGFRGDKAEAKPLLAGLSERLEALPVGEDRARAPLRLLRCYTVFLQPNRENR